LPRGLCPRQCPQPLVPLGGVIASATIIRSAGAADAVSVDDGGVKLTVSVPDVLLAGIVNAEQVTPGGAVGQVTETACWRWVRS